MKKILNTKGGITLIALVITIIVLLILAGVTIVTLTGKNGLLAKAQLAKERNVEAEQDEKDRLDSYEDELAKYTRAGGSGGTVTVIGKAFGIDINTEGEGTESSPYIITNKEQLSILATLVNLGNTFQGKYIKLANNITLDSTKQWTPIGNDNTTRFEGTFDGDGKTISGLYIDKALGGQGFFGTVGNSGTVKNFTLEGSVTISGGACVVATNYGNIVRCINRATLKNKTDSWNQGGICCGNHGTIYQCANLGKLEGYGNVAGIAALNGGIIKECYNDAQVSGIGSAGIATQNGQTSDGGLGYIYNCYNKRTNGWKYDGWFDS